MNKFQFAWEYIKKSTLGKLYVSAVLVVIGAVFGTDGIGEIPSMANFFDYVMYIGLLFPIGYALVAIFYAWILFPINELKDYLARRREKKSDTTNDKELLD